MHQGRSRNALRKCDGEPVGYSEGGGSISRLNGNVGKNRMKKLKKLVTFLFARLTLKDHRKQRHDMIGQKSLVQ